MVAATMAALSGGGFAAPAQQAATKSSAGAGVAGSVKAGWQLLSYEGCRFAVPASWRADASRNLAVAPDGSSVSVRMFRIKSWPAHKAQIKAAFGRVTVIHEDSDRRLWFEIGDKPRVQHYVDVPNGLTVCSALLDIRFETTPDAENTTAAIAASVGTTLH